MSSPDLARAFKALGNDHRLTIMRQLLEGEAASKENEDERTIVQSQELAEELPIDHSTICYHLRVMVDAGLLNRSNHGPSSSYWIDRDRISDLNDLLSLSRNGA